MYGQTFIALDPRELSRAVGGYASRVALYLREMYPPVARLVLAALLSASLLAVTARVHGVAPAWASPHPFVAAVGVFLFMLILRLSDELKDVEIDRDLFADRPLPSGRVRRTDIAASLAICVAGFLLVNALTPAAWPVALGILGYAFLMFRYFFAPGLLRRVLLLNLITHNPVVPLLLLWVLAVFADQRGLGLDELRWRVMFVVLGMYWSMFLAWEIGRKIRAPEEENAYVTYSQILGRRTAVLATMGLQTLAFVLGLQLQRHLGLSWAFPAIMLAGLGTVIFAGTRFYLRPTPRSSELRPFAERYIVTALGALLLGALLQ